MHAEVLDGGLVVPFLLTVDHLIREVRTDKLLACQDADLLVLRQTGYLARILEVLSTPLGRGTRLQPVQEGKISQALMLMSLTLVKD